MSFLSKLENLMSDNGIENISQLSRETGLPYTTIDGFYKKGTENIKLSTLRKLANYFNCSLDFLVDDNIANNTDNEIQTIAAHHDGIDWTEEELEDIENFKRYVLSKRRNKE